MKNGDETGRAIPIAKADADPLLLKFEVDLCRTVLESRPNDAQVLQTLGSALTRLGRHQEALVADQMVAALLPEDEVAYYNLACSYSNLARLDESLAALRKAVELGYRQADYMTSDPDLENVRRDPRFREIVELMGSRSARR